MVLMKWLLGQQQQQQQLNNEVWKIRVGAKCLKCVLLLQTECIRLLFINPFRYYVSGSMQKMNEKHLHFTSTFIPDKDYAIYLLNNDNQWQMRMRFQVSLNCK